MLSNYKSNTRFDQHTLGDRHLLAPRRTSPGEWSAYDIGPRNRTMLTHQCWFSKKPHIQRLTVAECIKTHPHYMIWVYDHLSINWSVYAVRELEALKKEYSRPVPKSQPDNNNNSSYSIALNLYKEFLKK